MAGADSGDRQVEILVRIVGPRFVAGVVFSGEEIMVVAPYLAACLRKAGLSGRQGLRTLVRRNRWKAAIVADLG